MEDIVQSGYFKKSIAPAIAILLALQIVMPFVVKSDGATTTLTRSEVVEVIEPLKMSLRDLTSLNENQRLSDRDNTKAHQELTTALIILSGAVERVAIAVERLDK